MKKMCIYAAGCEPIKVEPETVLIDKQKKLGGFDAQKIRSAFLKGCKKLVMNSQAHFNNSIEMRCLLWGIM